MLRKVEIKDFESHKHTVIEDFSDALNLICGESNSGKTSIVRALKLVAYNHFDPKCIRVGAKKCEVMVETEKGTVKVIRGKKDNLWEVTPVGEATRYFDKVGKAVVPEAAQIIGLNIVELGDIEVPVNIMDQLESHFMLAGVGDKSASGSVRAQIVDEISGLSGIEGIIKEVSLDNHRWGRDIKESEKKIIETQGQLHDKAEMDAEKKVLTKAAQYLKDHDDCLVVVSEASGVAREHETVKSDIKELEDRLKAIPDTAAAIQALQSVENSLQMAQKAQGLAVDANIASGAVKSSEAEYERLEGIGDPMPSIQKAEKLLERVTQVRRLLIDVKTEQRCVKDCEDGIVEIDEAIKSQNGVIEEILKEVKVCPLTLGPVSEECLKEAKV